MALLELDDIQSGVLRPRPTPFAATYILLRIDDRAAGRALMRRLSAIVASAAHPQSPARDTWVSASLTFAGLERLGVPQASLDSFSTPFRQGMAARARQLHDVGENAPEHWEKPLGTSDVHVVLTGISTDAVHLEEAVDRARAAYQSVSGITPIWRQDCYALPNETEPFGFKDGISHPAIEGSGIPGTNPHEIPLKPGEFVLGYTDEYGGVPAIPQPEVLGRNGTYIVFRKLHQRVAAFRRYLKANASTADGRGVLGGKDDGTLAQRSSARDVSGSRRSRSRRRLGEEQRLSVQGRRSARIQDAVGLAHPPSEPARCRHRGRGANSSNDSARHGVRAASARGRSRG